MRVVDSIPHPRLKITIFSLDTRWMVQVEDGPAGQIFKYKKEAVRSVDELKSLFDEALITKVEKQLAGMKAEIRQQLDQILDNETDDFPMII